MRKVVVLGLAMVTVGCVRAQRPLESNEVLEEMRSQFLKHNPSRLEVKEDGVVTIRIQTKQGELRSERWRKSGGGVLVVKFDGEGNAYMTFNRGNGGRHWSVAFCAKLQTRGGRSVCTSPVVTDAADRLSLSVDRVIQPFVEAVPPLP